MGRINCNALAVLDMNRLELLGILLLDQTAYGAANPWAVAWTPDGKTIVVSYAGTHEVSFIDAPVDADSATFFSLRYGVAGGNASDGPPRTRHPVRVRKRLPLPGNGPRALAVAGARLYVANYFSDNLCRIDLTASEPRAGRCRWVPIASHPSSAKARCCSMTPNLFPRVAELRQLPRCRRSG